jgi:nucleoside-diphosphate-sugar epimerase
MKVLVTGHKGYIGTVMVPMLLAAGHEVVGLDSDLYRNSTFSHGVEPIFELRKDIRDVEARDLRGLDAIIHLAALSNDPLGNLDPQLTYEINYMASVRLAKLAKEVGVERFLFASSCSIYGAAGLDAVTEEAPFNPVTPYGHSKVLVEQDVAALADDDFSPTFMRNATAYGVSPRHRFDLVLNNLVAWAMTTGRVLIKSDGTPWRPIVHIEDISQACIVALNTPREVVHNQAFNVGSSEENYQIRDIADIVKDVVPGCVVEYAAGGEPDKRSYQVDFSKINRVLPQFKPQWTARLGAQQLLEAYQQGGLQLDDFEGTRYRRIDQIKQLLANGGLDKTLRWKDLVTA